MSVQLAFYEGKSLISRLIKLITRCSTSHIAFLINNKNNKRIIEMWYPNGLREEKSLSSAHDKGTHVHVYDIVRPNLSYQQQKKLIRLINKDLKHVPHIRYDFWHLFLFLPMMRIFFEDQDRGKTLFCSEYCSKRLMSVGCKLLNEIPYKVSPGDLRRSPRLKLKYSLVTH
jgi:hypothetical protein